MLVLSRKLGEKIYIGENICITVVDIDRGKIRLGIEAPRDVPIYRRAAAVEERRTQRQRRDQYVRGGHALIRAFPVSRFDEEAGKTQARPGW